jgi:cystathionine beta-synthase
MSKPLTLSATIGCTPLVKVPNLFREAPILAKIEYFNPGLSVKDRIALHIVNEAEKAGKLKPGGTIIETSSGNTGIGLAIIAAERGYKFICCMNTSHSPAKINLLKAYGAQVDISDKKYPREHPQSSHGRAAQLVKEIDNSYWVNQYVNQGNPLTHYTTTGKEIWEQTQGRVTHLIASASTGGTISGTGRYLKEKNPRLKVWAADSYGSALADYHTSGTFKPEVVKSYLAENVGKKFIPETLDFEVVDEFIKVTDQAAALMAREAARKQGLLLGYSCGAALQVARQKINEIKPTDCVVVICPDHGSRYMHTIYNDAWMIENNLMEQEPVVEKQTT